MNRIETSTMVTPAGELILGSFDGCLCLCDWQYRAKRVAINQRITDGLKAELVAGNNEILTETKRQLAGYFSGKRQTFSIPLLMVGTPFQKQVWEALREINYGKTESYLLLSKRIGNVKAIRAVAAANGANALAIIIPCHRIIGSNGDMVGYAGGLPAKKRLLTLEGAFSMPKLPFDGL